MFGSAKDLVRLSVSISRLLDDKLKYYSYRYGVSKSALVGLALGWFLDVAAQQYFKNVNGLNGVEK